MGETVLPRNIQKATGQGPEQPDLTSKLALLWAGMSKVTRSHHYSEPHIPHRCGTPGQQRRRGNERCSDLGRNRSVLHPAAGLAGRTSQSHQGTWEDRKRQEMVRDPAPSCWDNLCKPPCGKGCSLTCRASGNDGHKKRTQISSLGPKREPSLNAGVCLGSSSQ